MADRDSPSACLQSYQTLNLRTAESPNTCTKAAGGSVDSGYVSMPRCFAKKLSWKSLVMPPFTVFQLPSPTIIDQARLGVEQPRKSLFKSVAAHLEDMQACNLQVDDSFQISAPKRLLETCPQPNSVSSMPRISDSILPADQMKSCNGQIAPTLVIQL